MLVDQARIDDFAKRISEAYREAEAAARRSLDGLFETGRLLNAAKASLPHGQFERLIKNQLPFAERMAEKLMRIARNDVLTNPSHGTLLPPSCNTLDLFCQLDPGTLEQCLKDGSITPDMERSQAEDLVRAKRNVEPLRGARAIAATRTEPVDSDNFFPTPPWATRALLEHVLPHLGVAEFRSVWEPACGEGHMAEVLWERFSQVAASDINEYGYNDAHRIDFLTNKQKLEVDWIITNPPFDDDKTIDFVLRALERSDFGVAMFVRSQWAVEGIERYNAIFRDNPPTCHAFFTERVNICKGRWDPNGSTATAYCWLVWLKGIAQQPPYFIPPGCRDALTLEDDVARFTRHPVAPRLEAAE